MDAGQYFDKESAQVWRAIDGCAEADLSKPIRDDGWSAFQILSHLAISCRGLLALAKAHFRAASAGQEVPVDPGFDLNRWNEEQVALWAERSLADVRTDWAETQRRFHAFIAELSEADLELPARFVTGTPMKLGDLIGTITFHLRIHRQEIERGLAGEVVTTIEH